MLLEYAIDPRVAADFNNLRVIAGLFDFSNPRRISRFPETWEKIVYEEAGKIDDDNKKDVEIWLMKLDEKQNCVYDFGRDYDEKKVWFDNARSSHAKRPFYQIVSDEDIPGFIRSSRLDRTDDAFIVSTPHRISKTPQDFVRALEKILAHTMDFHIVDPFYSPYNVKYVSVMNAIFDRLNQRPDAASIKFGLCTSSDRPQKPPYEAGEEALMKSHILSMLRPGNLVDNLQVSLIPHEQMHDRFILSDLAGFTPTNSIDRNPGVEVSLNMMDKPTSEQDKAKYFPQKSS